MAVDLNNLSTKTLVELFNLVSDKPTKKFESKEAGIKRLTKVLADTNNEVFITDDNEHDVRPIGNDDELTMLKFKGDENLIKESDLKPTPAEDAHAASNKLISNAIADNPELAAMVKVPEAKTNKKDRSAASREVGRQSPLLGKTLTLVRAANPKRLKSRTAVRYEIYRVVTTSDEFVRICEEQGLGTRREILSDLAYDSKQEFIKLTQPKA